MAIIRRAGQSGHNVLFNVTTLPVVMALAPLEGNKLIMSFGAGAGGAIGQPTIINVVQTGVTWSQVVGAVINNQIGSEIWVGEVGAGASPNLTINVTDIAGLNWDIMANIYEYSGLKATNVVDGTASHIDVNSPCDSGTHITTFPYCLGVMSGVSLNSAQPWDGAWTVFDGVLNANLSNAYCDNIFFGVGTVVNCQTAVIPNNWNVGALAVFRGYAFYDDFELGDLSRWTAPVPGAGSTITVDAVSAHNGAFGCNCASNGNWAFAFVGFIGYTNCRYYLKMMNYPDLNQTIYYAWMYGSWGPAWSHLRSYVRNVAGVNVWGISSIDSVTGAVDFNSAVTPNLNQWYCVEMETTLVQQRLWIDGELVVTGNNIIARLPDQLYGGITDSGGTAGVVVAYFDDYICDYERIYCLGGGLKRLLVKVGR